MSSQRPRERDDRSLLARMSANIASGVVGVGTPTRGAGRCREIAASCVDIAEAILAEIDRRKATDVAKEILAEIDRCKETP